MEVEHYKWQVVAKSKDKKSTCSIKCRTLKEARDVMARVQREGIWEPSKSHDHPNQQQERRKMSKHVWKQNMDTAGGFHCVHCQAQVSYQNEADGEECPILTRLDAPKLAQAELASLRSQLFDSQMKCVELEKRLAQPQPAPVDAMREALEAIADAARRYRDDMLNYQTPDGARNAMASLILLNAKVNAHETIKAALAAAKEGKNNG